MNKPVKLLASVSVLAFASMGLYYAWLAPRKTGSTDLNPPRQPQVGAKVTAGGTTGQGTVPASAAPAHTAPAQVPVDRAVATGPATPPGFKSVDQSMQPLPERLPGFEPVKTAPVQGVAVVPAPTVPPAAASGTVPAAPAAGARPTTVATTTPATVPAATPAVRPAATAASNVPTQPAASAVVANSPAPAAPMPPAPKAPAKPTTYTVKAGDSLAGIWRSITGSERGWEKLQAANPGLDPSRLKIGQVLKVPEAEGAATGTGRAPAAAATTTLSTGGRNEAPASGGMSGGSTHTVVSGDTLSSISSKHFGNGKHWKQIYEANKDVIGADPANLKVGQVLRIPAKGGSAKAAPAKTATGSADTRPVPASVPAPAAAPAPRAPAPPGTIGAPAPAPASAPTVSPAGSPTPR